MFIEKKREKLRNEDSLSAAEVLSNSRGEGFETIAFWGAGFSERRLHLGVTERRAGEKVDLERIGN